MFLNALRRKKIKYPVILIVGFLACFSASIKAQTNCLKSFQISLGGAADDIAYQVAGAGNNQFFTVGTTNSFGAGHTDILVSKITETGSIVWSNAYGKAGNETVRKIKSTTDGGLLLIGQTTSFAYSQGEIFCMKINGSGQLIWSKRFGIGSQYGDLGMDIIQTTDGGFVISGILNINGVVADVLLVRMNNAANIVWSKRFNSNNNSGISEGDDVAGILQHGDTLIVSGDVDNSAIYYTAIISKFKLSDGSFISGKRIIPDKRGIFNLCLYNADNNGYYISAHTIDGNSYAQMQPVILKLDANFNVITSYSYKVPGIYTNDYYTGFAQINNGFVACASTQTNPTGYLFYINSNGSVKWSKKYTGKNNRSLYSLQHIDDKIITVGRDNSSGKGNDFFVAGFSEDGFIDSLCHPDTSEVAITHPTFTTTNFTWASVTDQTFIGTSAPITVTNATLTATSLCDACLADTATIIPSFNIPDTVCVNTPVNITNTSTGASTYYWNFCSADINHTPTGTNLGNPNGSLHTPVFADIVSQNGKYYAFVTDYSSGELTRLDFGNSMLNTPTGTDLGTFGGKLPLNSTEGIQVVFNENKWYALIVGGTPTVGTVSKIVRIAFGASLENPSPVATNWGNIGTLALPHDLHVFQEGPNWYGFTINKDNNTVTRFNFSNSFENKPTGTNLGTFTGFNLPTGIFAANDNGKWYVFVVNSYDEGFSPPNTGTITRLDFGASLLSTPTAVNLGNIGNTFHNPRDIYIIKFCGESIGFVVNHATNDIVKLDFNGDIGSVPTAKSLGNIGSLNFPHSISKLFRVGSDLYSFICNAADNTITRLKFAGCNNTNTPNSTAQNPPPVTYTTPGIYNINLTIDDGLPTQNSLCKQVTVLAGPNIKLTDDTTICSGDSINLNASQTNGGVDYSWLPKTGLSNPNSSTTLATPLETTEYHLTVKNGFGCTSKDSVTVKVLFQPSVATLADTAICSGTTIQLATTAVNGNTYKWSPAAGLDDPSILSPLANPSTNTQYIITINPGTKCFAKDTVNISVSPSPSVKASGDTAICTGTAGQLIATTPDNVTYSWLPAAGLSDPSIYNPVATPSSSTRYFITVTGNNNCTDIDSIMVNLLAQPTVSTLADTAICSGTTIQLATTAVNGNTYKWTPAAGLDDPSILSPLANPSTNTQYIITINPGTKCFAKDTVNISVSPSPSVKASGDTAICTGTAGQLIATTPDNVTYSWLPAAGLSDPYIYNPVATPSSSTQYFITVTGNSNCTAIDSIMVNLLVQPSVTTLADTAICSGTTIELVTTAINGSTYKWSPAAGLSDAAAQSPLASPADNTQYIITVNPGTQCFAKDTINITVNPSPSVKASGDTAICMGAAGQLMATSAGNITYNWSPATGLNDPSVYNPIASPPATTQYFITVTGNNQCTAKDSLLFSVLPQPTVATLTDTAICSGVTIQLTTTAVNGNTYSWSPAAGLSDPAVINPSATPATTTQYIITVNPGDQCFAKDTVNITVNQSPAVQAANNDTTLCLGASEQLTASSPNNVTYSWSPSAGLSDASVANPVAMPSSSTNYFIQVIDNNNCTAKDSVLINVIPQPVFAIGPALAKMCIGEKETLTASGGDIYQWSPLGTVASPNAASTLVFPQATTTYTVVITNSTCKISDTLASAITVSDKLEATVSKSNDVDCVTGQAQLTATGGNQYTWLPAAGLSNPRVFNPVASPNITTTYSVTIRNSNGCVATDTVTVKVSNGSQQDGYRMISAFTPNGDGINDCFGIKYWGGVSSIQFEVYNRWGNRVFYTNDQAKCWDGTFKGVPQPPGTYVYQITANTICGIVYRKGTVVLIR